jgi:hypothetical protein
MQHAKQLLRSLERKGRDHHVAAAAERVGGLPAAHAVDQCSKRLEHHAAAVSLYVAHYNLCRVHEALRTTPAVVLGIADRVWGIGDLLDAGLATQPIDPLVTAPDRRRRFRVIQGGGRA